ncbi:MAG TPA: hypothetical protein VGM27_22055 [Acidobacteriaceae bacterium]|jgi:CheY-like chemotaxis protein
MTLLLVDDDVRPSGLLLLRLNLSGFTALVASGPFEGLSIMAQQPARKVDIAVLDFEMRVMNGCALADYLSALPGTQDHPAFRSS